MADLSLTYTLTNGTNEDADQVMQDFNDIKNYVNANVIRTDGVTSMAAALNLSGDPSSAAHAVRKSYFDGTYVLATGAISQAFTSGAAKTVLFSAKTYDYVNGAGDTSAAAYALATGVFTAPKTGVYLVSWTVSCTPTDAFSYRMQVLADGVTYLGPRAVPNSGYSGGSGNLVFEQAAPIHCTAAATIQPQLIVDSSVTRSAGNALWIAWLHA